MIKKKERKYTDFFVATNFYQRRIGIICGGIFTNVRVGIIRDRIFTGTKVRNIINKLS